MNSEQGEVGGFVAQLSLKLLYEKLSHFQGIASGPRGDDVGSLPKKIRQGGFGIYECPG
jgi:hypothetical protein